MMRDDDDILEQALATVVAFNDSRSAAFVFDDHDDMSRLMSALLIRDGLVEIASALRAARAAEPPEQTHPHRTTKRRSRA